MKKNVLIFGHGYATQFIDVNNQYTELFDKEKYHITLVYLIGKPDKSIQDKHLADEVIFLNTASRITRGLKISVIRKMLHLHRMKQFEIVICHRYKPSYIMLWVNLFHEIPALFCVMHELKTMQHFFRKLAVRLLASTNTYFAGVSNAVRDDLRQSLWGLPEARIITLYNMIDVPRTEEKLLSRKEARQELKLLEDDFVFGTLGRLAPAKDHTSLIEAFRQIKIHCPRAKLMIVGSGDLEMQLRQQIAAANLTTSVFLPGFVQDAFRLVKAFDVFVLPSVKEAFGRVLLEAMLGHVPIIAAKSNGIPEVVGDAGFLVPAKNPEQLAESMLACCRLNKLELQQWGDKGYERATTEFSLRKFNEVFWSLPLFQP